MQVRAKLKQYFLKSIFYLQNYTAPSLTSYRALILIECFLSFVHNLFVH